MAAAEHGARRLAGLAPADGDAAPLPRWPLFVIAAPAAVAVWSGWVGLGGMCGFGVIHPLPGIGDGLQLNTAITLPVGVEAYGAYALGAWLTPGTPERARAFARRSAIGALALGMLGQVIYHLLAAAHAAGAVAGRRARVLPAGRDARVRCRADAPAAAGTSPYDETGFPAVPAVPGLHLNGSGLHPAEAEPFADRALPRPGPDPAPDPR